MSARYIDYSKRTPGPTDYDNNTLKVRNSQPGYSMKGRSKSSKQLTDEKNEFKPSPSQYCLKGSFNNPNGTVMGTSARKALTETEATPAPNYYMAEKANDFRGTSNPRCQMGGEPRNTDINKHAENTPGPAYYDKKSYVDHNKDRKKGYSCRSKTKDLVAMEISKYPAPGMYESHLKNKHQSPTIAATQSARKTFMDDMQDARQSYPGPGAHNGDNFVGTKYRSASASQFGKSNRKDLCKTIFHISDEN